MISYRCSIGFLLIISVLVQISFAFGIAFSEEKPASVYITIDVNPNAHYQTINGWEGTAQIGMKFPSFPKVKERIIDLAVNDLGLNRLRIEIPARTESNKPWTDVDSENKDAANIKNDDGDSHKIDWKGFQFASLDAEVENIAIPLRKALGKKKESLYLSACYMNFDRSPLHRDNPDEYAELMLAVFLHLKQKFGFVPDAVEMILEPENAGWNGNQIGKAMVATAKALKANGFHPDFIAPSAMDIQNALIFFDQMIQVPGVSDILTELSYHRYRGASESALQGIASRAAKYHIRTSMLELIGASSKQLHEDLKIAGVSAWEQYTIAYRGNDTGGAYYRIYDQDPENPTVEIARRTGLLRQYFRYIRRNAVRIGAVSSDQRFDPLAFVNENGKFVIVIQSSDAGMLAIKGLPRAKYGLSFANRNQRKFTEEPVEYGDPMFVRCSGSGVLTIFGK